MAKGKAKPVRLFRARSARGRFGSGLIGTHAAPFVGRQVERALFQGLFDRSARDGSAQLVTLVGEPGIGKSRLVAELFSYIDELPELITWRQGRCLPYGEGITFWALGEVVKLAIAPILASVTMLGDGRDAIPGTALSRLAPHAVRSHAVQGVAPPMSIAAAVLALTLTVAIVLGLGARRTTTRDA